MPHRITDIPVRPGDRRNLRKSYVMANAFEVMLAIAAVVSGVSGLLHPEATETSALGDLFGVMALVWCVVYVVSGGLVLVGIARPIIRVEVVGLCLLAGGIMGNAVALFGTRGWVGVPFAVFLIGWAFACIIRARLVIRLSHIIRLGPPA